MKKLLLVVSLFVIAPVFANASPVCEVGQKIESVMVSASTPAVTHIEVVIDAEAYDETVVDVAAYDEYVYVGSWQGDYVKIGSNYTQVNHNWGNYDKVSHPAVTHIVHHDAVTHEVVVTDTEAVGPVYEDQCVADSEYVAPAVKIETKATVGGSSIFRKLCNLNTLFGVGFCPVNDPVKGVEYASLYTKLIEELKAR